MLLMVLPAWAPKTLTESVSPSPHALINFRIKDA